VAEGHTVGDPDKLPEPEDDEHREAVGLTLGLLECVCVTVGHALSVGVSVLHPEAVGDRVAEGHTVGVPDILPELEDDKHRDVVGLLVGLIVRDGVPVAQPLDDTVRVGDGVTLPLPLPLRHRDAVGDCDGDVVAERQREGEPLPLGLLVKDVVPVAQLLDDTVRVGDGVTLPLPLSLRHRDAVGD
jgi:hypothetical protein